MIQKWDAITTYTCLLNMIYDYNKIVLNNFLVNCIIFYGQ